MISSIINKIKAARKGQGLTQAQLAAQVGASLSAYKSIELGRRLPSLPMLLSIISALGGTIHISYPTGKKEPTPPEKKSRPHRKKRADPPEKESRPHRKKRADPTGKREPTPPEKGSGSHKKNQKTKQSPGINIPGL